MENNKSPLISIITVSFNCVKTIEETILSVINQSYTSIEYIIIDGKSTDGTIEIKNMQIEFPSGSVKKIMGFMMQ